MRKVVVSSPVLQLRVGNNRHPIPRMSRSFYYKSLGVSIHSRCTVSAHGTYGDQRMDVQQLITSWSTSPHPEVLFAPGPRPYRLFPPRLPLALLTKHRSSTCHPDEQAPILPAFLFRPAVYSIQDPSSTVHVTPCLGTSVSVEITGGAVDIACKYLRPTLSSSTTRPNNKSPNLVEQIPSTLPPSRRPPTHLRLKTSIYCNLRRSSKPLSSPSQLQCSHRP